MKLLRYLLPTYNERVLRKYRGVVAKINDLESSYESLSDEALRGKTAEFKEQLAQGVALDELLVPVFATVREVSKRVLGMRHYDTQLLGGMALHHGQIAQMQTGEGKTLVSTLPAYLNALLGHGVHIVTVNEYLAQRDKQWMQPLYDFLGVSTAVVLAGMEKQDRQSAYAADITYGTNNELGFDYLRDNMCMALQDRVQRLQKPGLVVIDEVDSILIDEARTPLIISGPSDDDSKSYGQMIAVARQLTASTDEESAADVHINEKDRQASLTEQGHARVEVMLHEQGVIPEGESLYDTQYVSLNYFLNAALRAHFIYQKDVDYIVSEGKVMIIDEHTGRSMPGRRWGEGLHQAVEAKEEVSVEAENITLASITFQNFFRQYGKIAGMTGTADTEAKELKTIYDLDVIVIPTHRPMVRQDLPDKVYATAADKVKALVADIKERHGRGQPILVGTASIESSEMLSSCLKKEKIKHQVLNAKYHESEAKIIAQAGCLNAVTIATHMAGRGTDIILGGSPEGLTDKQKEAWHQAHEQVLALGGLHILGTERNESRRIDNQLRGRAGRQGDPGSSQFWLSLEDNLLRIFASNRMAALMQRLGLKGDVSIEDSMINRAIENAQRKVEGHYFDTRKQLLKFDNIANDQRMLIYQQRLELQQCEDVPALVDDILYGSIESMLDLHQDETYDAMLERLQERLVSQCGITLDLSSWASKNLEQDDEREALVHFILEALRAKQKPVFEAMNPEQLAQAHRMVLLQILDVCWRKHLQSIEHLRRSIHLRGYANKDPFQEFKRETYVMFQGMLDDIKARFLAAWSRVVVRPSAPPRRNDDCPCKSGKKYKHCCGAMVTSD